MCLLLQSSLSFVDLENFCWEVNLLNTCKEASCCCLPSETYGRNGATPIFRSFFTELPVPPQVAGVVGTFNVLDIYPSEHYGLSFFGPYGCLSFTRSPFWRKLLLNFRRFLLVCAQAGSGSLYLFGSLHSCTYTSSDFRRGNSHEQIQVLYVCWL